MGPPSPSCMRFLQLSSGKLRAASGAQKDTGLPPWQHPDPTRVLMQPSSMLWYQCQHLTFTTLQEFVFIFLIPPQPFFMATKMWILPLSDTFIQMNDGLKRMLSSEGKFTWCGVRGTHYLYINLKCVHFVLFCKSHILWMCIKKKPFQFDVQIHSLQVGMT